MGWFDLHSEVSEEFGRFAAHERHAVELAQTVWVAEQLACHAAQCRTRHRDATHDDARSRARAWYARNAERVRARAREYHRAKSVDESYRAKARERARQWRATHAEQSRAACRNWYDEGKADPAWVDAYRAKKRESAAKRRAQARL